MALNWCWWECFSFALPQNSPCLSSENPIVEAYSTEVLLDCPNSGRQLLSELSYRTLQHLVTPLHGPVDVADVTHRSCFPIKLTGSEELLFESLPEVLPNLPVVLEDFGEGSNGSTASSGLRGLKVQNEGDYLLVGECGEEGDEFLWRSKGRNGWMGDLRILIRSQADTAEGLADVPRG